MVQRVFSPDSYLSQQDKGVMYVSVYDLSYELDISELQLRMSLSHLVQTNVISELTHVYGKFKCGVVVNEKAYQKVLSDWAQGLVDQGTTSMLNDMIRATTTTPPTTETMKRLANVLVTILRKEGGGGGDTKQASRWVGKLFSSTHTRYLVMNVPKSHGSSYYLASPFNAYNTHYLRTLLTQLYSPMI